MYKLKFVDTFERDFKNLDKEIRNRVLEKVKLLAKNPQLLRFPIHYLPEDLKHLQKYRIGDWRVYLWVDHKKKEIVLYGVEHRREAYKRFKK